MMELSKKFGLLPFDIDKIKAKFDHFDVDKSGEIEYSEFESMMMLLLGSKSKSDLPADRMLWFWKELDKDGGGSVDFPEFIVWYAKYFIGSGNAVDSFYASFMPDVQRCKVQEAQVKAAVTEHMSI